MNYELVTWRDGDWVTLAKCKTFALALACYRAEGDGNAQIYNRMFQDQGTTGLTEGEREQLLHEEAA